MLKILDDVYATVDGQCSTCLVTLDLSAAFDTLDHATIIDRLRHTLGIESSAHVIPHKQVAIREVR